MTKMTKKEMFAQVLEILASAQAENIQELRDGIQHEIDLLNTKKPSASKTKNQKENEKLMKDILGGLVAVGHPVTITELQTEYPDLAEHSNQKLSALLKKLVETETVIKVVDKRKSYFSLA